MTNTIVADGEKVGEPNVPTRINYSFAGWYKEQTGITVFDFNTTISADLTLYAKWTESDSSFVTLGSGSDSSLYTLEGFLRTIFGDITTEGFSATKYYAANGYMVWISVSDTLDPAPKRNCVITITYPMQQTFTYNGTVYNVTSSLRYCMGSPVINAYAQGDYLKLIRGTDDGTASGVDIDLQAQNNFGLSQYFESFGAGYVVISGYGKRKLVIQTSGLLPAGTYVEQ